MSRRRGFGNVRKLPSGRWQARYWLPGGGHLAAPGTFATKAEANRWLATVEADRARGLWVDPRADDRFHEVLEAEFRAEASGN